MAFIEGDRVYLRRYLGFSGIFFQADPRLESAITAIQSSADGGTRPDNTSELQAKAIIYGAAAIVGPPAIPAVRGLLTLEASIANLDGQVGALSVNKIRIDAFRETIRLRYEGRRLCSGLATLLSMRGVRSDVFSSNPKLLDEDPFRNG